MIDTPKIGRVVMITPLRRGSVIRGPHEILIARVDGYNGNEVTKPTWQFLSGFDLIKHGISTPRTNTAYTRPIIEEALRFPSLDVAWWVEESVKRCDERFQVVAVSTIETLPSAEE